ncbi:MAG: nuclear transport factor 2 family protein [Thermoleophilaceae bacterium]
MAPRAGTHGRSKEHHVAVGLEFLSAFKRGDIDACIELLHPEIEWYPTPKLLASEALTGREDVRQHLQTLHDRFSDSLEIAPEDGRQVGDHVLLITLLQGRNHFTKQPIKTRECWVISIRDDKWGRIVAYPNAPAARLGFEQLLGTTIGATDPSSDAPSGVTLAPAMDEATPTPAELANAGPAAPSAAPPAAPAAGNSLTLTFSFEEAEALSRWMLKPAQDGALAADDAAVRPGLMKIRTAVEHAQALNEIRHELEHAGVPTQHLSDQQVAQLSRRISQATPRLGGSGA